MTLTQIIIASKDWRIQKLYQGTNGIGGPMLSPTERMQEGMNLAAEGLAIDPQCDIDGDDPGLRMHSRQNYGMTKFPCVFDPIPAVFLAPGVHVPGIPDYDETGWRGVVSTDPNNYPPFAGPKPVEVLYVGPYFGNGNYNVINATPDQFKDGQEHYEGGFVYTFHKATMPQDLDSWHLERKA